MHWVVLPDCPDGAALAGRIAGPRRIDHASGRPWIIGDWDSREFVTVTAGARQLALIGPTSADKSAIAAALGRMRTVRDLDRLAAGLPGSCHLSASWGGGTRVQGSVTGVRQVFTTVVNGVSVAASAVTPLLCLAGLTRLDDALLAARLLAPSGPPWPLSQRPVHHGIDAVPAGNWLLLDADGRGSHVRWWELPPASRSLPEAADALRGALLASMSARVSQNGTVSADLSGGVDSTSLCFLAAAAGADLVTYHVMPLDTANEDTAWAEKAAALLPSARHHTLPADRAENLLGVGYGPGATDIDPEGPATWASGLAHVSDLAARAVAEGSAMHLTGFGGDELFGRMPACAWSLARARPVSGLRLVNRYRLANRWPLLGTVRSLLDSATFAEHLAAAARHLAAAAGHAGDKRGRVAEPHLGWTFTPQMPPWATPDAVSAVSSLLAETAAAKPRPLDRDRTRHQALASLLFEGSTIRHLNTALEGTGISWEAPFLDDRVVEAALSARIDQRLAGGRYKPLLASALRDIVPADLLGRRDKGEFSAEGFQGIRRNREQLLELCEDSRLAGLGLIDQAEFRAALLNPGVMSEDLQPIITTVACESWLRSHSWQVARERGRTQ